MQFDVARQVRVFNAYLQYVELSLTGAAIQRHRLAIPPSIQNVSDTEDLEGRLKTTFDLIEKGGKFSSKALEQRLNEIRKNFTPSLGKDHGRVVLKSIRPRLEEKLVEFRRELQSQLDESRRQIVDHYVPSVTANPPEAMRGRFPNCGKAETKVWLNGELDRIFPEAKALIQKMHLEVKYKDVTFETLNQEDFLDAVKETFPHVDWEIAYDQFLAAGERKSEPDVSSLPSDFLLGDLRNSLCEIV